VLGASLAFATGACASILGDFQLQTDSSTSDAAFQDGAQDGNGDGRGDEATPLDGTGEAARDGAVPSPDASMVDTSIFDTSAADTATFDSSGPDTSSTPDTSVAVDATPDAAACVDTQSDSHNCGQCGHDCLGGVCSAGVCQPLQIALGQGQVTTVVLDDTSIYWGRAYPATGALFRSDRDGQNLTPLHDFGDPNSYVYVVGSFGGYVYFLRTSTTTSGYLRCLLPDCAGGPIPVADGITTPSGGAIDTAGGRVYWARRTLYNNPPDGTIFSAPLDGSQAPVQVVTSTTEPGPNGVVVAGGAVYWVNGGTYTADNFQNNASIRKAPLGQGQTATTLASLTNHADAYGLVVDTNNAYALATNIVVGGTDLLAVSKAGGAASVLVPMAGTVVGLYADSVGVFWMANGLLECPSTGCNQMGTQIANVSAGPLTADAKAFAWGTGSGFVYLLAR
jgi:hypothetical protein